MKLSEICEVNPKGLVLDSNTNVSFVAMPDVSEDGKISTSDIRKYHEVKKGYTSFIDGDVLLAKITPCMENGKGALATGLINGIGFGSTEFHVLRPLYGKVDGKWLHLDSTWDDPVASDGNQYLLHNFFLIDTKTLLDLDTVEHSFGKNVYKEAQ